MLSTIFFQFPTIPSAIAEEIVQPIAETTTKADVRKFESFPLRQSKSGRVIVFRTNEDVTLPKTGKLVLLRENGKPIYAFRIIRNDESKKEYIGRLVRKYETSNELSLNQTYESIEKMGDITINNADIKQATPSELPEDYKIATTNSELNELQTAVPVDNVETYSEEPLEAAPVETDLDSDNDSDLDSSEDALTITNEEDIETLPYDSELDATTSPSEIVPEDKPLDFEDEVIEEPYLYFPDGTGFGIHGGFMTNLSGFSAEGPTANGAFLSASTLLGREWFTRGKGTQDRMLLEGAVGFYRLINFAGQKDNYTMMPVRAELRYDLDFSPSIALNFYIGFQYNLLIQSSNALRSVGNYLQGAQQTIGTGVTFRIGPHWYVRGDLGWDRVALGLMLHW